MIRQSLISVLPANLIQSFRDFRKTKKVDNLGPVTFLTRIWTKVANVEKDISSDVEMMQL